MGPLVPDIITNELSLIVALLVGIGFGFIIEQAGFSSSRKLTGLFYGTDFTVLRVFFAAGATAMTGVLLLADVGLLDSSVIYVNPTFVYSALAGGAVMGIGFVVGGYCPGTSFAGAAVGRIDAMTFVLGGLIGAFGFGEAFPHVQRFYLASAFGDPTVPAVLGITPGVFALATIVVAISAFALTTRLERRVNPSSLSYGFSPLGHRLAAGALLCAGVLVALTPDYQTRLLAKAADEDSRRAQPIVEMSPDELAYRILDHDASLMLIDVRSAGAFARSGLPGAVNIRTPEMFGSQWRDVLARAGTHKIFIAQNEDDARTAASLSLLLGYDNAGVLEGGMTAFTRTILEARAPASRRTATAKRCPGATRPRCS